MLCLHKLLATTVAVLCIFATNDGHALVYGETKVVCVESEGEALLKFKQGFKDTSNSLSSWTPESDCCKWKGVECNSTTGHVVSLDLGSENIQGVINSALLGLPYLTYLNLSSNDFMGSQVPAFLGSLDHLQLLILSSANFSGIVSDELRNLSRLISLDLSYNSNLTANNLQWLHGLSSLKALNLSGLNLNNTAHGWFHAVHLLPSLEELHLSDCQLHDLPPSLPSVNITSLVVVSLDGNNFNSLTILDWLLQSCPHIFYINLSNNNLTGPMPSTLGNHTSLRELHLSYNHLYGPLNGSLAQLSELFVIHVAQNDLEGIIIDADFKNFSNLLVLILSRNHVIFNMTKNWILPFHHLEVLGLGHCQLGPQFPSWIQNQTKLSYIDISYNNISDIVPNWFWNLSTNIVYMNLSYNDFRGQVPDLPSNLSLEVLDLSNNSFDCPFPHLPPTIWILNLARNSFFGPISYICQKNISHLVFLDLSSNNLSGNLPNCWTNGRNLIALFLANNDFSGPIPDSFGSLTNLQALSLNKNNFSGALPSSLKNCSSLILLDVGRNQLSRGIPSWIGSDLQSLKALKLDFNAFEGNIPKTLCQLRSLQILDLSSNRLSGTISRCAFVASATEESVGDFYFPIRSSSYLFYLSMPLLSMEPLSLTWKGSYLAFNAKQAFAYTSLLDLSSNFLTGGIPDEITSNVQLNSLNLSRNQLVGSIPFNIGKMKKLEALDLSMNKLSGIIPTSLSDMYTLGVLNVSYNNLTGQIPSGNHMNTLDSSCFMGNPNLCGRPLTKSCYTNLPPDESKKRAKKKGVKIPSFYISIEIGFITGFGGICGPLLLSRRWRQSYYRFVGNMYDKLYAMVALKMAKWKRKLRSPQDFGSSDDGNCMSIK